MTLVVPPTQRAQQQDTGLTNSHVHYHIGERSCYYLLVKSNNHSHSHHHKDETELWGSVLCCSCCSTTVIATFISLLLLMSTHASLEFLSSIHNGVLSGVFSIYCYRFKCNVFNEWIQVSVKQNELSSFFENRYLEQTVAFVLFHLLVSQNCLARKEENRSAQSYSCPQTHNIPSINVWFWSIF